MQLIVDSRERAVSIHTAELNDIKWQTQTITTGDYAIVGPGPNGIQQVLVIFERKTLKDAASSMKDGRWNNRDKMFELRAATGCVVVFIIEGLPQRRDYATVMCGRTMQYRMLESSLIHMMVRDDVRVIWTQDTIDTAETLVRWVKSMGTLRPAVASPAIGRNSVANDNKAEESDDQSDNIAAAEVDDVKTGGDDGPEPTVTQLLTAKHERSDIDILREMWAAIRGITVASADNFIKHNTIADLLNNRLSPDIRTAGGRQLNKTLQKRLADLAAGRDKALEIRILAVVPGFSRATAAAVIEHARFARLLTFGEAGIAMIQVGKKRVGEVRAARLIHLCHCHDSSG